MPITTSTSSPSSSRSSPSPTSSRRGSWGCEKMSMYDDYNEKDHDQEIYMGALVSPGGGDWEKSIEVPCIILSTFTLSPSVLSFQSSTVPLEVEVEENDPIESMPRSSVLSLHLSRLHPLPTSSPLPNHQDSSRSKLTISRTRPSSQSPNPYPTQTDPPTPTHLSPTPTPFDFISSNGKPKTWMGVTVSCCTCCLCSRIRGLAFMGCIGWWGEGRSLVPAVRRLTAPRPSTER